MRKFMLVGKTGVGKSSFINSTFGKYIARTSEYESCTKIVEHYAYNTPLGSLCLIDTPGLAEDNRIIDEAYLDLIKKNVDLEQIDALIYVTRLDETRFRADEKQTLRLLTNRLGSSIWARSWLVLTFAASIPEDQRKEATQNRVRHIEAFLQEITSENNLNPQFKRFQFKLRVDNVVRGWTKDGAPILPLLTKKN